MGTAGFYVSSQICFLSFLDARYKLKENTHLLNWQYFPNRSCSGFALCWNRKTSFQNSKITQTGHKHIFAICIYFRKPIAVLKLFAGNRLTKQAREDESELARHRKLTRLWHFHGGQNPLNFCCNPLTSTSAITSTKRQSRGGHERNFWIWRLYMFFLTIEKSKNLNNGQFILYFVL